MGGGIVVVGKADLDGIILDFGFLLLDSMAFCSDFRKFVGQYRWRQVETSGDVRLRNEAD